jgi:hypothetical protein
MPSAVMSRYLPCRRVCPLLRDNLATEFVSAQLSVILQLSVLTSKRVRTLHPSGPSCREATYAILEESDSDVAEDTGLLRCYVLLNSV